MSQVDLIDIIGVGIILIVLIELIVISIKLFIKYSYDTDEKLPLWFAILFSCYVVGIFFLILQQIFFRIIINYPLGRFFTYIAFLINGISGFFSNYIFFDLISPQNKNKLMIPIVITIIFLLIFVGIWVFAGEPYSYISDGEFLFSSELFLIYYIYVGILTFIAPTVFIYFAIINRENKSARIRSIWLGIAFCLLGVAYLIEINPIVSFIAVPVRVSYIVAATIAYIVLTKKADE